MDPNEYILIDRIRKALERMANSLERIEKYLAIPDMDDEDSDLDIDDPAWEEKER